MLLSAVPAALVETVEGNVNTLLRKKTRMYSQQEGEVIFMEGDVQRPYPPSGLCWMLRVIALDKVT